MDEEIIPGDPAEPLILNTVHGRRPFDVPHFVDITASMGQYGHFEDWRKLGVRVLKNPGDTVYTVELSSVVRFHQGEGWYEVYLKDGKGRPRKERGKFVTVKIRKPFEVYWRIPRHNLAGEVMTGEGSK